MQYAIFISHDSTEQNERTKRKKTVPKQLID